MSTDSRSPRLEQSRAESGPGRLRLAQRMRPMSRQSAAGNCRNCQRGLGLFVRLSVCLYVCLSLSVSVCSFVCKLFEFMRLPRRKWHRGCHLRKHANKISVPPCNILCISQIRADLPATCLALCVCVCVCVYFSICVCVSDNILVFA